MPGQVAIAGKWWCRTTKNGREIFILKFSYFRFPLPKTTLEISEIRLNPKRKGSSSNHPLSRAMSVPNHLFFGPLDDFKLPNFLLVLHIKRLFWSWGLETKHPGEWFTVGSCHSYEGNSFFNLHKLHDGAVFCFYGRTHKVGPFQL